MSMLYGNWLDYQLLFSKASLHSILECFVGRNEDRARKSGGNQALL